MEKVNNIFLDIYPKIDLHGVDRDMARVMTHDFILENIKLGNDKIVIIHGKGSGIVKTSVYSELTRNKAVLWYKSDNFNAGATIVCLKLDK